MEYALLSAFQCIEKVQLWPNKLVVAQSSYSSSVLGCVFQKQLKICFLNTDVFLNFLQLYSLFMNGFSNLNREHKNPGVGNTEMYKLNSDLIKATQVVLELILTY